MRLLLVLALAGCQLPEFVADDTDSDNGTEDDSGTDTDFGTDTDLGTDTDVDSEIELPSDEDTDGSPEGEDCDDSDPNRFPDNVEICNDGTDQDCSGEDCVTALVTDIDQTHIFPDQAPVSRLGVVDFATVSVTYGFGNASNQTSLSLYDNSGTVFVASLASGGGKIFVVGGPSVAGDDGSDWIAYRPQGSVLDLNYADAGPGTFDTRIVTTRMQFNDPNKTLSSVVPLPGEGAFAVLVATAEGGGEVYLLDSSNASELTYAPRNGTTFTLPGIGYGPPTDIVSLDILNGQSVVAMAHAGDSVVDDAQVLIVNSSRSFTADPESAQIIGTIDIGRSTEQAGVVDGPVLYTANLDDNGIEDLVVGLPGESCVYLFKDTTLQSNQLLSAAWHTYCGGEFSRLGWAFTDTADRDNDGLRELVITAPGSLTAAEGALHVLYTGRLDTEVNPTHPVDMLITSPTGLDPGLGTSITNIPPGTSQQGDILVTTDHGNNGAASTYVLDLNID